ncbi:hypothetical protein ONZ43_g2247 [Nemania bipapillata]|uniref:Uncharacterized protein n=1 Tax=Nemania bipapillata TaxID=110536 RepID=A0ACC2J249_9PEZI|nr:hypothetical protein ONZ43_g2247 [Nemania bipapillata]
MAKALSAKQLSNERTLKILAAVISVVLTVLIINHWIQILFICPSIAIYTFISLYKEFPALKNTPLAVLIGYPHNHLNYFHRVAGYVTIGLMLLHTALYPPYYVDVKLKPETLIETDNVMGIVSGSAMFLILLSVFFLKRTRYEVFYVAHLVLFIVSLVTLALHRPEWIRRTPVIALFAGALWFSDRMIRGARLLCHLLNNEAKLIALSGTDGWVRAFETHPFTIVSNGPGGLELVSQAEDGFTRSLHEMAQAGMSGIRAAADGPYGSAPDLTDYNKIILVAGGSGATFTFGLALNALESARVSAEEEQQEQEISMIWATRRIEHTQWFDDHANTLVSSSNPRFNLTYFITGDPSNAAKMNINSSEDSVPLEPREEFVGSELVLPCKEKDSVKMTTTAASDTTRGSSPALKHQKLNLEEIIMDAIQSVGKDQRVLVACCGPDRMSKDVRNAVAQCLTAEGPSITLHCESFSW